MILIIENYDSFYFNLVTPWRCRRNVRGVTQRQTDRGGALARSGGVVCSRDQHAERSGIC